jgi:hypothetical protein
MNGACYFSTLALSSSDSDHISSDRIPSNPTALAVAVDCCSRNYNLGCSLHS